jgi:glycosyltransferase involved in cell wall biosynthesis
MTSATTEAPAHAVQPAALTPPPRISVVIATMNGEARLQRALDSIAEQTYPHVEVVVMDGGSRDATPDILRRNEARIAYWESSPDSGIFNAWNKALDHVTGDWVCFLGADDWYAGPGVMAQVAEAIAADGTGHRIYYGHMDKHHDDGRIYHARERRWSRRRRRDFRRGVMVPQPAAFHDRTVFDEFGRFDESFGIAGDYELLLRVMKRGEAAQFMDVLVVNMTAGGMSQQPRNRLRIAREVYRARYKQGVAKVPAWRSPALYRSLVQTWLTYRLRPAIRGIGARLGAGLAPGPDGRERDT